MSILVINEDYIEEDHVCWFTTEDIHDSEKIVLVEVVKRTYRHPQAKEVAVIQQYELKFHDSYDRRKPRKSSHVVLMEYMQENVSKIELI